MSRRNPRGVRRVVRRGKSRIIIDFRYRDRSGRSVRYRHDAAVQTMTAAAAEAERLRRFVAEHGSHEALLPAPTFGEFVDGVFEREFMPRYRPATVERYRDLLRQGLRARLQDVPLDEIVPGEVRRLAAHLAERGVQLKGPLTLVRTIVTAAVAAEVIEPTPPFPKLWREGRTLPEAPAEAEVAQLLAEAREWLRVAIGLGAFAGLRSGEVRALETRDVDLGRGVLRIRRAFSGGRVLTPKSGHERVIPIAAELRSILTPALVGRPASKDRVVLNKRGRTPSRQHLLIALKRLEARIGLRPWSFHSLRHGFCSNLIRRGASLEAVRLLAGHASLAVTQRYVHAAPKDLTAAIELLENPRPIR